MLDNHIAWLREQQRRLIDQIRVIENKEARYFRQEGDSPEIDITADLQAENMERLKRIEGLLARYGKK